MYSFTVLLQKGIVARVKQQNLTHLDFVGLTA